MLKWFLKLSCCLLLIFGLGGAAGILMSWSTAYLYLSPSLADTSTINELQQQSPLKIYSADGTLMGKYGSRHRRTISYANTPEKFKMALLAAEDDRYFEHNGVDAKSIARAVVSYFNPSRGASGGSTITMQVAKMFFLDNRRTIERKLKQIFLAWHIEKYHSKETILQLYINKIFLGHGAYGAQTAAYGYYNKPLSELTLAQTAMIAGLPKAPSTDNPITNPDAALERRNWILRRMSELNYIGYSDYITAKNDPITAQLPETDDIAIDKIFSYPAEEARRLAHEQFGDDIYTGGYTIYTSIHTGLQRAAQQSVIDGLHTYTKRHGYRGAEGNYPSKDWNSVLKKQVVSQSLHPAIVTQVNNRSVDILMKNKQRTTLNWQQGLSTARPFLDSDRVGSNPSSAGKVFKRGDLIRVKKGKNGWYLAQIPKAQAALVAVAPQNGQILAMTGGFDFKLSSFNRATQAKRQPGSSIKPLVYASAMELKGFSPNSIIQDEPISYNTPQGKWKPQNSSRRYYGPTRLRTALVNSRNVVAVRLLEKVGVDDFIRYMGRFGIDTKDVPRQLSISLGTSNATPTEIANIYADIANGGYHVDTHLITRIEKLGNMVFQSKAPVSCSDCSNPFVNQMHSLRGQQNSPKNTRDLLKNISTPYSPSAARVMDERVNFMIDSMLKEVITDGSGKMAKKLDRVDIAGKTGTTNGPLDAWFSGYHPQLAVTTWLGFDRSETLGKSEYGGTASLPIWVNFMKTALKDIPVEERELPEDLVWNPINKATGKPQRNKSESTIQELFREEYLSLPKEEPSFDESNPFDPANTARVPVYDTQSDDPNQPSEDDNWEHQAEAPTETEQEPLPYEQIYDDRQQQANAVPVYNENPAQQQLDRPAHQRPEPKPEPEPKQEPKPEVIQPAIKPETGGTINDTLQEIANEPTQQQDPGRLDRDINTLIREEEERLEPYVEQIE